jgi:hypothetical protein
MPDLSSFRARAREWIAVNLEPLNGADPFSERVLGMPREPAPDLGLPFREVRMNAMPSRR